ncbi:MAG: hypothetical protein VB061_00710 [Christensenella sp.]|nr:hypothetical protein [Christensenella sp.]
MVEQAGQLLYRDQGFPQCPKPVVLPVLLFIMAAMAVPAEADLLALVVVTEATVAATTMERDKGQRLASSEKQAQRFMLAAVVLVAQSVMEPLVVTVVAALAAARQPIAVPPTVELLVPTILAAAVVAAALQRNLAELARLVVLE